VRDCIASHHKLVKDNGDVHQVEFMFRCRILEGSVHIGETPDEWQTGVEWVQVSKLDAACIYPEAIVKSLQRIAAGELPDACYLGDVN